MKSDRNEAITKNDQFLIIYSGTGRESGALEIWSAAQKCTDQDSATFCNQGRAARTSFVSARTQIISMRGCQCSAFTAWFRNITRHTCQVHMYNHTARINKPECALSTCFYTGGIRKKTRVWMPFFTTRAESSIFYCMYLFNLPITYTSNHKV